MMMLQAHPIFGFLAEIVIQLQALPGSEQAAAGEGIIETAGLREDPQRASLGTICGNVGPCGINWNNLARSNRSTGKKCSIPSKTRPSCKILVS
jgi:hypothetical protein